ncbi:MAG: (Fe-S)-binding protein [Bacteroidetes bacterium]|nr:MAG: (Fe-S)-binding protein [Bacteroidota bacterium]
MKVELFVPCYIDQFAPQVAWATVTLLEKLGCKVSYNPQLTCCGQSAYQQGYQQEAREVALKCLADLHTEADYIVAPSPSCVGMLRKSYPDLVGKDMPAHYADVQRKALDLSEFLTEVLRVRQTEASLEGNAIYLESCASRHECGIQDAPLRLLKGVKGLRLLDVPDREICCGFGGTFATRFPAVATAMAEQKVDYAMLSQADYIISTEFACLQHLEGYIKKQGKKIKCLHLAEVLVSGW